MMSMVFFSAERHHFRCMTNKINKSIALNLFFSITDIDTYIKTTKFISAIIPHFFVFFPPLLSLLNFLSCSLSHSPFLSLPDIPLAILLHWACFTPWNFYSLSTLPPFFSVTLIRSLQLNLSEEKVYSFLCRIEKLLFESEREYHKHLCGSWLASFASSTLPYLVHQHQQGTMEKPT